VTGYDLLAVGNALIDHTYHLTNLPGPDEGAFVESYEQRLGGVATNVGTMTTHLGHEVGLVASVGRDDDGDAVEAFLRESPVDVVALHRVDARTSYCLVLTDAAGNRAIIGGGESTLRLSLSDADLAAVEDADATFTSAYVPIDVVRALAGAETPLVFDLAGEFTDLTSRGLTRSMLDDIAEGIDCLVGNLAAVQSYIETDAPPQECCTELAARGFASGAVTDGADGVHLFDGDEVVFVPAFDVDVVDTTGAGDAFTAGLVHAWLLGDSSLEAAGRFASAAAALNCTATGAHTRSPSRVDVESMLDARK